MRTKYRITRQFSLNAENGFPETNFMVEKKEGLFGKWTGVRMFVTEIRALKHIEDLKAKSVR